MPKISQSFSETICLIKSPNIRRDRDKRQTEDRQTNRQREMRDILCHTLGIVKRREKLKITPGK